MIRRVLVANRGEIAVRVIRACREARIEAIAVCSEVDRSSLHAALADRTILLGPAPASESYLSIPKLIDAARACGADAIHPGYGFLSENAEFAAACEDAGIAFIGPTADAIERMGSKIGARRLMADAGVPVVPGATPDDQTDDGVRAAVERLGFPALLKASAGGGGRGMRVVRRRGDLADAIGSARREAVAAFGDGTLYVERLIEAPRHVEIQILADEHGNTVHLFERECSVQRRHQKIIEESPCPAVTPEVRERMGAAAIRAADAVRYRNAGTVEFLVEGTGAGARFYFLEMNTRLQVEHPVTEAVTGVDLVRAQLRIASGDRLPWAQDELSQRGHAIECRVYAEDPARDFLPAAGRLLLYREPTGPGVRVDSGVTEGLEVPVHYDPLLAKLIVSAESRDAAIERGRSALHGFPVLGVRTNIPFLIGVLEHPAFEQGDVDTGFVEREMATLLQPAPGRVRTMAVAAAAFVSGTPGAAARPLEPSRVVDADRDPWQALGAWGRPA
jgi:acetyl-CoA carboxylase biotin carboxylase subunit